VSEGTLVFTVDPGATYITNVAALPVPGGQTPPPCERYVLAFSWQVTAPYPADDVEVAWSVVQDGTEEQLGSGPDGMETAGCGELRARNNSDVTISVLVHYLLGSTG
jgi:hypothetical protein